jgi:hypothetical protein
VFKKFTRGGFIKNKSDQPKRDRHLSQIDMEDIRKDTVAETWWHRLLRVLMYASTCLVLVFAGFVLIDSSDNYTYSYTYSIEPDYESADGEEHTCHSSSHSFDCGEFTDLSGLVELYQKWSIKGQVSGTAKDEINKIEPKQSVSGPWEKYKLDRPKWQNDPIVDERSNRKFSPQEFEAYKTVINDLKSNGIRYKQIRHWQVEPLSKSVVFTLGIAIGWYLLTLALYKIILFIAYGHTNVRRV